MKGRSSPRSRGPARIAGVSIAEFMLRGAPDRPRRDGYRIVISAGLWRGFEVSVEPPTSTHLLRGFASRELALEYAEAVERIEGWPVIDKTGELA